MPDLTLCRRVAGQACPPGGPRRPSLPGDDPGSRPPGFTLIEFLIVLVVVGILYSVAVPRYLSRRAEAEFQTARALVANARSALSIDFASHVLSDLPYVFPRTPEGRPSNDISGALEVIMVGLQTPPLDGFAWRFVSGTARPPAPARVSAVLGTWLNPQRTIE